jgi:hypothetical protein
MTNTTVDIHVQLTFQDCCRAFYWSYWWKSKLPLAFVAVLLPLGIVVWASRAPQGLALLVGILAYILCLAVTPYWRARRFVASHKTFLDRRRLGFSDEGLTTSGPSDSGSIRWDAFYRSYETRHNFLLYISRVTFITVPKRCFTNAEEIRTFRSILQTSLPNGAKLR